MGKKQKKVESYIVDFERQLGEGSFANVYLCHHEITKDIYAAKMINKEKGININKSSRV